MQPSHAPSDRDVADAAWGDRAALAYAWRALADAGAALAFGSDAPIEPMAPLDGIHAAVNRTLGDRPPWRREQALTVAEAVAGFTRGAAYAAGRETRLGRLVARLRGRPGGARRRPVHVPARADRVDRRRGHDGGRPLGARPAAMVSEASYRLLFARERRALVLAASGASFLVSFDALMLAASLPSAARELGGLERFSLAVGAYAITLCRRPAGVGLADRAGRALAGARWPASRCTRRAP